MREESRRDRYFAKRKIAKKYPIYMASINFQHDANFAFLLRSASCFGITNMLLIGSHPSRKIMNELSGTMFDYVNIEYFKNTTQFLSYIRENNIGLVSLELPGEMYEAHSILNYEFKFDRPLCIITGHESVGIPGDILLNSEVVYIPMPGIGFCLNTSQSATVAMYEAVKQYEKLNG